MERESRIPHLKEAHRRLSPRRPVPRRLRLSLSRDAFNYETDMEERVRRMRDPDDEDLRWEIARDEYYRRHGER